jgi:DNA-binding XRE family transcriptional regulator
MTKNRSPCEVFVELREKADLTQEQLAKAIGVTDHTVRNWEKGRSIPRLTISQVKALCRALKCSLDDLPDDLTPGSSN